MRLYSIPISIGNIIFLLLLASSLHSQTASSQFSGGSESGKTFGSVLNTVSCANITINRFSGGSESLTSFGTIKNSVCSATIPSMFAGGGEKSSAFSQYKIQNCSASQISMYGGGADSSDAFAQVKNQQCPISQLIMFGGGVTATNDQAFMTPPRCKTLSVSIFGGGISSKVLNKDTLPAKCSTLSVSQFNGGKTGIPMHDQLSNADCKPANINLFGGGTGDGFSFLLDANSDCLFDTASITSIPKSACLGSPIEISGKGFLSATGVFFNGIPAKSFTINSSYSISAVMPAYIGKGKITVVANGKNFSSVDSLNILPVPSVSISPSGLAYICSGSLLLKANTSEKVFLWSTGQNTASITVNQPGEYFVRVTNAQGCATNSDTVVVKSSSLPVADFAYNQIDGLTFNFKNNSLNANSYKWDFGDGSTSSQADPSYQYTSTGTFNVKLIVQNECGSDTAQVKIVINPTILESRGKTEIFVYPNPFNNLLYLDVRGSNPGTMLINFYDMAGKLLMNQQINPGSEPGQLEIQGLPVGIYNLQIISEMGIINHKVLKTSLD